MATARDLIKGSLRLIGAIATGETPSADEQADGLSALNDMLASWSNERLLVPTRTREELSVSASPVTIGDGATLDTERPLSVDAATVLIGAVEYPLEILSPERWQAISQKDLTSSIPTSLFIEGTFPNETLNLWPAPAGSVTLVLYSWKAMTSIATANTTLSFPDGYLRALRYNLAVELAPEYGRVVTQEVAMIAREAKANIKRMNKRPVTVVSDALGIAGCGPSFDLIKGE